jgi:CubicO group peptidase (beta-lactamase class C family)
MDKAITETAGMSLDILSKIDPLLQGYIDSGRVPGFSVLIGHNGRLVLDKQWGVMDMDRKIPMTPETIFRVHSLTKPVTAVAFLQLFEKGLVRFDTPLEDYLPVFGNMTVLRGDKVVQCKRPILLGHLLTMSAGFSYGADPDNDPLDHLYAERGANLNTPLELIPVGEFFEELTQFPLAFQPGESWRYGFSYDILGHVIEIISGQNLEDYCRQNLFDPLGMKDTGFFVPMDKKDRTAALYRKNGDGIEEMFPSGEPTALRRPPFCMGGSGLYSTTHDYGRFCEMLLQSGFFHGERILGRKTIELIRSNHLAGDSLALFQQKWPGYGYGLGVRVLLDNARAGINGTKGEFGWDGWAGVWMMVDPAEKLFALLMMQLVPDIKYKVQREFQQIVNAALV